MSDRLLLDTRFLVATEVDPDAMDELIGDDDDVAIAAVTLAELRYGTVGTPPDLAARRTAFIDELLRVVTVVGYDQATAEADAAIHAAAAAMAAPLSPQDLMVAATAVATDRILVSSDKVLFDGLPGLSVRA